MKAKNTILIAIAATTIYSTETLLAQEKQKEVKIKKVIVINGDSTVTEETLSEEQFKNRQKEREDGFEHEYSFNDSNRPMRKKVIIEEKEVDGKKTKTKKVIVTSGDETADEIPAEEGDGEQIIILKGDDKSPQRRIIIKNLRTEMKTEKVEEIMKEEIKVYPNPSDGSFNIDIKNDSKEPAEITITDNLGKEIYKEKLKETGNITNQIDLKQHDKGVYLLKIKKGNKSTSKKIIIE